MRAARWEEIVTIFERAADLADADRVTFLAAACPDPELRSEVESLLRHATDNSEPAAAVIAAAAASAFGEATASDELVGMTLGNFVIDGLCGRGGMGVVYRATDQRLARVVALKVLPDQIAGDSERRLRFLREAKVAATVTHPNIATIYEVGDVDGRLFIAMELVNGRSLRELLSERRFAVDESLAIAGQILAALGAAHTAGITHRDLKPENVMITADGTAKVLDFGLATSERPEPAGLTDTVTHDGGFRGTPSYMSPEQARGGTLDRRSDIFSFGVMLYEMVTGARPFGGIGTLDLVTAILRDDPEPATARNAAITPQLSAVIARCLAKDPAARYASCAEVVSDLDRNTASALVTVLEAARSRRRRRVIAAIGAAVTAGAIVVAWTIASDGPPASTGKRVVRCLGAEAGRKLATAWSPRDAQALRRVFAAATSDPDSGSRAAGSLDDFGAAWIEAHRRACEIGLRSSKQTRTLACLARQRDRLGALVDVLTTDRTGSAIARAGEAIHRLAEREPCDEHAIADGELSSQQEELVRHSRELVDRAFALELVGAVDQGLAVAADGVEEARQAQHDPTLAEALMLLVRLQLDAKRAVTSVDEAGAVVSRVGDRHLDLLLMCARATLQVRNRDAAALDHAQQCVAQIEQAIPGDSYALADALDTTLAAARAFGDGATADLASTRASEIRTHLRDNARAYAP